MPAKRNTANKRGAKQSTAVKEKSKTTPLAQTNTKSNTTEKTPVMSNKAVKARPTHFYDKKEGFFIVGIGASAGGLEALEGFFSHVPSDSNMAYVVIQHLDPTHKSIMDTLLGKYANINIHVIEDKMKVEKNCIYLNPPDKEVAIINRSFQLMEREDIRGSRLSIDSFFRSLSEDQGEKAVCVILSGTGTDGTLGLKAIKAAGGLVMVQEEKQAKYDGMPRSAIDTGLADFVLPVEKMPNELISYVQHPYIGGGTKPPPLVDEFETLVYKIFVLIRGKTGHDFSNYKQTTLRRRIERRMAVHQIHKLSGYVQYLQQKPLEVEALFKDLLITVTSFFRDPESYELLGKKVIPELLEKQKPGFPLRIWVPGCATGEEVYSLAILIAEIAEKLGNDLNIQIFATDIDEKAIGCARRSVYPHSIEADVSQQRLSKFFTKGDTTYTILKHIRIMVIFANHNLIKDPPYSKLDLIMCRNVLIYMNSVLQKKIIPMFHYMLNPNGFLVLGSSESIGKFTDLFTPVDSKWKIFKNTAAIAEKPPAFIDHKPDLPRSETPRPILSELGARQLAEKVILENYALPCVLINESYTILYFHGKTERYLSLPVGDASFNILKMVREDLHYKLLEAINQTVKQQKITVSSHLETEYNGQILRLNLIVKPIVNTETNQALMMVVFDEKTSLPESVSKSAMRSPGKKKNLRLEALKQELRTTREHLQKTIEELETSNEEFKSTNEELQSTNEELQSTNEELGTSKEELQSTNEELTTINAELMSKMVELSQANNDLNNLISSTEIGTVFLDVNLCIKRFTPQAIELFNIIATDIGRPISDITTKINLKNFNKLIEDVLGTLNKYEQEVMTEEGKWFALRILPYRTIDNVIDGVVITFTDITRIREAEKVHRLAAVVSNSNDAITEQDLSGKIIAWNKGAEKLYGYTEAEAKGMNISELIPENKKNETLDFIKKITSGAQPQPFEAIRVTKDGRTLQVWVTATKLTDDKGAITSVATTERNITDLEEILNKRKREG